MPCAVPEPYREVECFRCDVDAVVVGRYTQVYLGTGTCEPIKSMEQPTSRECTHYPNVQHLAKPSISILVEHGSDSIEHVSQHWYQRLPVVG